MDGSSLAITWPEVTLDLKSAPNHDTVPDTCEPTWTVVTACSVPVAETSSSTVPTSTFAVMKSAALDFRPSRTTVTTPAPTTISNAPTVTRRLLNPVANPFNRSPIDTRQSG